MGVIRTGPWRGNLLIQQKNYHEGGGAYFPTLVFRPDGKELFMIPGSGNSYGTEVTKDWMKAKGWDFW